MSAHRLLSVTLLVTSLALAAGPAVASHQEATLGSAGELYVLRTGTYGALFPAGTETDKDNPVLAVDILRPGAAPARQLVAGTKDKDVEGTPAAVFEDDSNTLFVIWESRINSIHSIFRLANFDGRIWSNPIEITGNPFSVKTPPQLAITRDSYRERTADGISSIHHRTVLHVSWAEENGAGLYDAFYTPIILDEGAYLGWNPVYRLDSFEAAASATASTAPPGLIQAPTLQAGRDGRTVVAAFASSTSGLLSTVEVDVLPTELVRLAEKSRGFIVDLGVRRRITDLTALSTRTKNFILENADDYQPEVARSIADQVSAYILSNAGRGGTPSGPGGVQVIAQGSRGFIVDLGAKFSGRGLKSAPLAGGDDGSAPAPLRLEIAGTESGLESGDPAEHIFQVRNASGRRAPEIGDGAVRVFASEAGDELVVSWAGSDRVTYRISQGSGWSDPREIRLSDSLDLNGVYDILAQRVRRR